MGGIVVGVDGSAHALDALRFAIEESRYRNCALLVVETWQVPYIAEEVGPDAAALLDEPTRQRAADVLQAQVDKALDGQPRPENMQVELRTGNPAEVLVELGRNRRPTGRRGTRPRRLPPSTDRVGRDPTGQPRTMPGHGRAERAGRGPRLTVGATGLHVIKGPECPRSGSCCVQPVVPVALPRAPPRRSSLRHAATVRPGGRCRVEADPTFPADTTTHDLRRPRW
jgi:hypothetical protein